VEHSFAASGNIKQYPKLNKLQQHNLNKNIHAIKTDKSTKITESKACTSTKSAAKADGSCGRIFCTKFLLDIYPLLL